MKHTHHLLFTLCLSLTLYVYLICQVSSLRLCMLRIFYLSSFLLLALILEVTSADKIPESTLCKSVICVCAIFTRHWQCGCFFFNFCSHIFLLNEYKYVLVIENCIYFYLNWQYLKIIWEYHTNNILGVLYRQLLQLLSEYEI